MPIHCTELPFRLNPSPGPSRRIANSMRRSPLRRQSFASSDPEHCQLNVRVAPWHRFLRCYPSSVLPSQYAGLPLQAPTSVSSLPPMYRWRPSIPVLFRLAHWAVTSCQLLPSIRVCFRLARRGGGCPEFRGSLPIFLYLGSLPLFLYPSDCPGCCAM